MKLQDLHEARMKKADKEAKEKADKEAADKAKGITPGNDYPRMELTTKNILSVLPASPADILYQLGRSEEYANWHDSLYDQLKKLEKDGLISGRSRTADDPVYYKV